MVYFSNKNNYSTSRVTRKKMKLRLSLSYIWFCFWFWQSLLPGIVIIFENSFKELYEQQLVGLISTIIMFVLTFLTALKYTSSPTQIRSTVVYGWMLYIMVTFLVTLISPYSKIEEFVSFARLIFSFIIVVLTTYTLPPKLTTLSAVRGYFWGFLISIVIASFYQGQESSGSSMRWGESLVEGSNFSHFFGNSGSLMFLFMITHPPYGSRFIRALATFGSISIALLAFTRTSLVGLLLGVTIILIKSFNKKVLLGVLLASVVIILMNDYLLTQITTYQYSATLTGRTPLWELILGNLIWKSPVLGFGYQSMDDIIGKYGFGWTITHAHNAYIDVLFTSGFVGLCIFVPLIASSLITILQIELAAKQARGIFLSIAIFLLVKSLNDSALHLGFDFLILLTLTLIAERVRVMGKCC